MSSFRKRFVVDALIACGVLLSGISVLGSGAQPPAKVPPPSESEQEQARQRIREIHADDYASLKTPAQKEALGQKLLQEAIKTKSAPASQFVLLTQARDLAVQAGDVETAMRAIAAMDGTFVIDVLATKGRALTAIAKSARTPVQRRAAMTYAVAAIDEAVKHDHFSAAQAFSTLAGGLANKCRDTYAARAIQGRTKQIREIQEAWEAIEEARSKLARDAADAVANAAVGRYLCFSRGDWELGLPLLARGSESQLKALAEKELKRPVSGDGLLELGNAWSDLAKREKGLAAEQLLLHGVYAYVRATPRLSGLAGAELKNRFTEAAASSTIKFAYLANLTPREKDVEGNTSWEDLRKPLALGEVNLQYSISAHPHSNAPSRLSFTLQSQGRCLMGNVVVNTGGNATPLTFRILGDGHPLWKSQPLHRTGEPFPFCVDLCAVHQLDLVVDCPGWNGTAWAFWVDPIIVRQ